MQSVHYRRQTSSPICTETTNISCIHLSREDFPCIGKGQIAQDSAALPELRGKMINDSEEQGMVNVFGGLPTKDQLPPKNASTLDKAGTWDIGSGRG